MHGYPDLTGITIVAVAATLCGMLLVRFRQPAIVGYILAGVILGPSGLGLVENRESITLLANLGVILLLYFIGMELSLRAFRFIWRLSLITGLVQIVASLGAMFLFSRFFGWPMEWAILFGFCLALSSTAVAVGVLEEVGELRTGVGRVAVGILIAQDLAVAPMLVVISNLAGDGFDSAVFWEVALSIGILLALILYLTRRTKVTLPFSHLVANRPSLAPLAALAWCFGFASAGGLIGLSPAFGAFLAGLIIGNSAQRQVMRENAVPVQAVLMMVFFLSIGLLIDLDFLWTHFWLLLALWLFVLVFKLALNLALLRIQGESWQDAFTVALVIGQVGEFSFVLAAAALSVGVIDDGLHRIIISLTVISLATSPICFDLVRRLRHNAAHRITTFRGLLRFAYFKEYRITRKITRAMRDLTLTVSKYAGTRVVGVARRGRGGRQRDGAGAQVAPQTGEGGESAAPDAPAAPDDPDAQDAKTVKPAKSARPAKTAKTVTTGSVKPGKAPAKHA